ncbi:MAG: transcription termination factor NusA [Verrucomicrobiae bacterium]|nr:transcription termination factor NusA [Verrucomicrobiae bacterium]
MNTELIAGLDYLEREKGIDREVLIEAIQNALLSASKKSVGPARQLRVEIDRKTGDIKAIAKLVVVEKIKNSANEITLNAARKIKADAQVSEELDVDVTPSNFGRIAAQTAKQAMMTKLRQIERDKVFVEFKDREGDLISGTVRRFDRSDVIIDLGKFEAVMPSDERVPTEDYNVGDRVRALVLTVAPNAHRDSQIVLSRSHPNFVRRLFELEVSEIADGTIEIKAIAREPGFRTKVAVHSKDDKIDPVGACIGIRGARVKNIVRELNNEKIDIVRFYTNIREYVAESLKPAKLKAIDIDEAGKRVKVKVDEDQLSLAIGKRGQNARLTKKLCGYEIDIERDTSSQADFQNKVAQAISTLSRDLGIDAEKAGKLVNSGFHSVEDLAQVDEGDLVEAASLSPEEAKTIRDAALSRTATPAQ